MSSKDTTILLNGANLFYPGDNIRGQIKVDLKKLIEVQNISLILHGYVEAFGDHVTLINETQVLELPEDKKDRVASGNKIYETRFSIPLDRDKMWPSSINIPKIGKVSYSLKVSYKKPIFILSKNVTSTPEPVSIMDKIDVSMAHYAVPKSTTVDLGFINEDKLTQWTLSVPKTAYVQGDKITVDCNIINFPYMQKEKAIVVSLIRQVTKPNSGRSNDNQTIISQNLDIYIDSEESSTQKMSIDLAIPTNASPNIFPHSNKILSVSYIVSARLQMKGVKSAVKIKPSYEQEITIVIGTYPSLKSLPDTPVYDKPNLVSDDKDSIVLQPTDLESSIISLSSKSIESRSTSRDLKPLAALEPKDSRLSIRPLSPLDTSQRSLQSPVRSPTPLNDEIRPLPALQDPTGPKPLGRLSNPTRPVKSYLPPIKEKTSQVLTDDTTKCILDEPYRTQSDLSRQDSGSEQSIKGSPSSLSRTTTPRLAAPRYRSQEYNSYQQAFDDYLPPELDEVAPELEKQVPQVQRIDRSLTPLHSYVPRSTPGDRNQVPGLLYRNDTVSTRSTDGSFDQPVDLGLVHHPFQ